MLSRINIYPIIRDHFRTLYNYSPGNPNPPFAWRAFFGFFITPLILAIVLNHFEIKLSEAIRNGLLTALTLLAGLMLNLLAIVYSMIKPIATRGDRGNIFYGTLTDTCSNISYSVLSSLISIIFLIFLSSPIKLDKSPAILQMVVASFNSFLQIGLYFLLFNIALTLSMTLRRIHLLMMEEIRQNSGAPNP